MQDECGSLAFRRATAPTQLSRGEQFPRALQVIAPKKMRTPRSVFRSLVFAYALVGGAGLLLPFLVLGHAPWVLPDPWISLRPELATLLSGSLGLVVAGLAILFTQISVRYFGWAQALFAELSIFARGLTRAQALWVAVLSGIAEELLFRGFVQPLLGLPLTAVVFGVLHRAKHSGLAWTLWAMTIGLLLGSTYALTGSLFGSVLAHVLVNAVNVRALQRTGAPPNHSLQAICR